MSKGATIKGMVSELTAADAARIETMAKELVVQIRRAGEAMRRDQQEIERLKSETRASIERIKTMQESWASDVEAGR